MALLDDIPDDRPVLIAGPTGAGKSALALEIADRWGGVIINADALQVYDGWNILTARPSTADLAQADHRLYGHRSYKQDYSVGHWLRDIASILSENPARPIITGGTGLYFTALTEGLADIPPTPADLRARADAYLADRGIAAMLAELDTETRGRIDTRNPMRVQRAWEVQQSTGRGLADWQDDTPPPLLPLTQASALVMDVDRDWLNDRICRRFDAMIDRGVLQEAEAMRADWDPRRLSSKAIGAPELIAHLNGEMTLDRAIELSKIASRQYAKRQRSWFRSRMKTWLAVRRPGGSCAE